MQQGTTQVSKRFVIWLVALVPLVVLLSGTYFAFGQPRCAGCHDLNAAFSAATKQASHSGVKCVDCHVSPAPVDRFAFGFHAMFNIVAPGAGAKARDLGAVDNARCLKCHEKIETGIVTANGIRIDHKTCTPGAQCTACHSSVGHASATRWARTYDMQTCLACHVANSATTKCDACHVKRDRVARVSTGIYGITHSRDWRKTHGMGDTTTCSACHTAVTCAKCHGPGLPHDSAFLEAHGATAADPAARCSMCHDTRFCTSCHGLVLPHPASFVRRHSGLAKTDPKLCVRCHAAPDCIECHDRHVHPGGAVGNLTPTTPTTLNTPATLIMPSTIIIPSTATTGGR